MALLVLSLALVVSVYAGSAENADLAGIPADWKAAAARAGLFYSSLPAGATGPAPALGNGYISMLVGADTMYVAGVFNGPESDNSHRAAVPVPAFTVTVGGAGAALLPLKQYWSASRQDHCLCATSDLSVCPNNGDAYG